MLFNSKMAATGLKIYKESDDLPTYDQIYLADVPQDDEIPASVKKVLKKYKVPKKHWNHVMRLVVFNIDILIDDSGSMRSEVEAGKTRWDEAQSMSKMIIEIGAAIDADGVNVHRLNGLRTDNGYGQADWYNQTSFDPTIFSQGPSGGTPLGGATQQLMTAAETDEKPHLIVIFTDGQPSDVTQEAYQNMIRERDGAKVFITFVACTADESDVAYLNGIDHEDCSIEVIDDYASEKVEVEAHQGANFDYSRGLHVIRILLSPIIKEYDQLDEQLVEDWDF